MTDTQTVWISLWKKAAADPAGRAPFEIDEVVPAVAEALNRSPSDSGRLIRYLVGELERLPDGTQYFAREGDAIVPLPEFRESPKDDSSALAAYPFET